MDAMVNPMMGGAFQPPPSPEQVKEQKRLMMALNAIALLRQDKVRGFRIDIETDSTISGNAEAEKEQRVNFIAAVTKFVETSAQVTQMVPEYAPLAAKMLQFGVRGFRVGRDLESAIEDFSEKAEQHAKQMAGQPKPPSPDQIKAEVEQTKAKTAQMETQGEIQRQQIENQGEQANAQIDLQSKGMDYKIKMLEAQIEAMRANAEMRRIQAEHMTAMSQHAMDRESHEQELERMRAEHKHAMSQVGKDKGE